MKTSITLVPTWETPISPLSKTQLQIQIDVTPISNYLEFYDLYLCIVVTIHETKPLQYHYTKFYRNVTTTFLIFQVTVMGVISSNQIVTASCTAYFINK